MASKLIAICALASGIFLQGCVSVVNRNGLKPPAALCSWITGTVGVPRGPIQVGQQKSGRSSGSVHLQEWIFSGASASILDLALKQAAANGGLKSVQYADYEQLSILGFVTVFHLTAYG